MDTLVGLRRELQFAVLEELRGAACCCEVGSETPSRYGNLSKPCLQRRMEEEDEEDELEEDDDEMEEVGFGAQGHALQYGGSASCRLLDRDERLSPLGICNSLALVACLSEIPSSCWFGLVNDDAAGGEDEGPRELKA